MNEQKSQISSRFSDWMRWRGMPSLMFSASVCIVATGFSLAHELTTWKSPRLEALVFPPVASKKPLPQVVDHRPITIVPTKPIQVAKNDSVKPPINTMAPAEIPIAKHEIQPVIPVPEKRSIAPVPVRTLPPAPQPRKPAPLVNPPVKHDPPVKPPVVPVVPPTPLTPRKRAVPPVEYEQIVVKEVPINTNGLSISDFKVVSDDPNIAWTVEAAERVENVERKVSEKKDLSVALLFDQSGSLLQTDRRRDRIPAAQKLGKMMTDSTRLAVVHFQSFPKSGRGEPMTYEDCLFKIQSDQAFTTDRSRVNRAIRKLAGKEGGGTPLYTALAMTIRLLATEPEDRERILICFSDGQATFDNPAINNDEIIQRAKEAHIRLYFVALGSEAESFERPLAQGTEGEVVAVQDSSRLEEAFETLAQKVSQIDHSFYRLRLRAHRKGKPFSQGEQASGTILADGQRTPFTAEIGK